MERLRDSTLALVAVPLLGFAGIGWFIDDGPPIAGIAGVALLYLFARMWGD